MAQPDDKILRAVQAAGHRMDSLFLIGEQIFVSEDAGDFQSTSTYHPYDASSIDAAALVSLLRRLAAPEYTSENELRDEIEQAREWEVLYDGLIDILVRHGKHDPFGEGDFYLISDRYKSAQHKIECTSAAVFTPNLVKDTQALLKEFDRPWEVIFALPSVNSRDHAFLVYAESCDEYYG